jgi:hypothetical protein
MASSPLEHLPTCGVELNAAFVVDVVMALSCLTRDGAIHSNKSGENRHAKADTRHRRRAGCRRRRNSSAPKAQSFGESSVGRTRQGHTAGDTTRETEAMVFLALIGIDRRDLGRRRGFGFIDPLSA